jgi:hypothetical protein
MAPIIGPTPLLSKENLHFPHRKYAQSPNRPFAPPGLTVF